MKVRKHIFFSGRVQGVGFRYRSSYLAQSMGLTGWVKNLWDGRVEMEVQGESTSIQKFLAQLKTQKYIVIRGMEIEDIDVIAESRFTTTGGW